jgi:hypothetical protein
MAKATAAALSASDLTRLLVTVADADTVHRDVYLRRARVALGDELPADQYHGMRGIQQQIDDAVARSRSAAVIQDWKLVHELAARADQLRRGAEASARMMAVGEQVYEAPTVALDPFSPGLPSLGKSADLAKLRDDAVAALTRLAAVDPSQAAFYEARRAYFGALAVARRQSAEADSAREKTVRSVAELERAAFEAADAGEVAELQRLAQEILTQKAAEKDAKPKSSSDPAEAALPTTAADQCPVDLGAAFGPGVEARGRQLGFATARTEPLPKAAPLFDYVAARSGQAGLPDTASEHEGAMKIEALVNQGDWPAGVADHLKVLVGQFIRNVFVNSGGARYRPTFAAESVLIEDFREDEDPPAESPVIAALGLPHRRGLARDDIEDALLLNGATVVADQLGLDPFEFRLVCIPHDLYSRFGREHGWGAARQWTHFDGYQVVKGGRLRALVGGDARYGGLTDLASIARSDRRDTVVARFAVIRRARQVARWR